MHDQGEAAQERKRAGGGVARVKLGFGGPRDAADVLSILSGVIGQLNTKATRPKELIDACAAWLKAAELVAFEERLSALETGGTADVQERRIVVQYVDGDEAEALLRSGEGEG
jgi:hypothetical protein